MPIIPLDHGINGRNKGKQQELESNSGIGLMKMSIKIIK